jgi:bacterioferritin-associated ferredoxin
MPVRKCVCCDVTFEHLAESGVDTLEEIRERFGCSTHCGSCRIYLEEMLRTGETAFPILPR